MIHRLQDVVLRCPEPMDAEALYRQKNDPEIASLLGGFSVGYSRADIAEWIERHRGRTDEVVWVIALAESGGCVGHAGLYRVDHRIRSAEFAIMVGDPSAQGRGIGRRVVEFVIEYGFNMLNLNRIELAVLATNHRARTLYERCGFTTEGVLREAQFKDGRYVDVWMMSILQREYHRGE